jgi:hypothetical protein
LGETQQEFASTTGLAISTVVRYELSRAPRGKVLQKFEELARARGLPHLVQVFANAQGRPFDREDLLAMEAFHQLVANRGQNWLEGELANLIEAAKTGNTKLESPEKLSHALKIQYLEDLLVKLRLRHTGPEDLLNILAQQRANTTGETFQQSYAEVLLENPELYQEYLQKRADAAKGTRLEPTLAVHGTKQHAQRQSLEKEPTK